MTSGTVSSRRAEAVFVLFFVSGFGGLIYESVWSHYLKLFLGHAAYAQTLVLVVFIGGLAFGSWLCARIAVRIRNPLRVYAWVEGAIGLVALAFHWIFVAATDWGYTTLLPATCDQASTFCATQWLLAAALMAPQSILLGATFPLVSSAVLRLEPTRPGHHIAALYFLNSLGAVLGVLASAFVLIPAVGLPGTLTTAGVVNLVLAATAWLLSRTAPQPLAVAAMPGAGVSTDAIDARLVKLLLATAFLTGLSSFIYEIVWIRMLSLVLGSSTHAFELMLASFILGLAIGGFWIRARVDRLAEPVRFLAIVQVVMGVAAAATVPFYNASFDVMAFFLAAISRNDGGFVLFNLTSTAIALAVMLPATICAGMTLPLITYRLLRSAEGERALGLVYSVNTVGSIVGVVIAVHVLLTWMGLHGALIVAAAIDVGLGLVLLATLNRGKATPRRALAPALAGVAVLVILAVAFDIDVRRSSSGVFRTGAARIAPQTSVIFHRDGKAATVDVLEDEGGRSIRTNGKPDASLTMNRARTPTRDEVTMMLLAVLPLGHRPEAQTAAVIGFGSGMSTAILLGSPTLTRVDTVEIEPAMVEGAMNFRPVVEAAYSDPRSRIVIDDAKSYFARGRQRYDIIVSEPSNPWVSGVASLFSEEFYARLAQSLNDGGVLAQWLHTYEMDEPALAAIFAAVAKTFPDFVVYTSVDSDIILVARKGGSPGRFDARVLQWPAVKAVADRLRFFDAGVVERRPMGSAAAVATLFRAYGAPANSDYYPIVDQRASKTRFTQARVTELAELQSSALPLLEMLDGTFKPSPAQQQTYAWAAVDSAAIEAWRIRDVVMGRRNAPDDPRLLPAQLAAAWVEACPAGLVFGEVLPSLVAVASLATPNLARDEAAELWTSIAQSPCARRAGDGARQWLELFAAVARRDADAMSERGAALLAQSRGTRSAATEYAFLAAVSGHLCRARVAEANKLFEEGTRDWLRPGSRGTELRYLYFLANTPREFNERTDGRCATAAAQ